MQVPFSTDIKELEFGSGSKLHVTIGDIADQLPLSSALRRGLKEASSEYAELSLHVLTSAEGAEQGHFEGRGRYTAHHFNGHSITAYSKGIGNIEAIRRYQGFSGFDGWSGRYLYDSPTVQHHFPRIIGALFLGDAQREFLHALMVMVNLANRHGYQTLDDLLANGVSIPLSVAHFGGLSDYFKPKVVPELEGRWDWSEQTQFGSASLIVPSNMRTNKVNGSMPEFKKGYAHVARTLKELFISSAAAYSMPSATPDNIYQAAKSICAQADNCDLFFSADENPSTRQLIFAAQADWLFNRELGNLVEFRGGPRFDAGAILMELGWKGKHYDSTKIEFPILQEIAERFDAERIQLPFKPQAELLQRIISPEEYAALEMQRRSWIVENAELVYKLTANLHPTVFGHYQAGTNPLPVQPSIFGRILKAINPVTAATKKNAR